jgi:hypothetical protein
MCVRLYTVCVYVCVCVRACVRVIVYVINVHVRRRYWATKTHVRMHTLHACSKAACV